MISPGLLLVAIGGFGVFLLLVQVIGAVADALDRRCMNRHKQTLEAERLAAEQQIEADRLAAEREKTARVWMRHGYCPACGAPGEDGPPITAAVEARS